MCNSAFYCSQSNPEYPPVPPSFPVSQPYVSYRPPHHHARKVCYCNQAELQTLPSQESSFSRVQGSFPTQEASSLLPSYTRLQEVKDGEAISKELALLGSTLNQRMDRLEALLQEVLNRQTVLLSFQDSLKESLHASELPAESSK